MLGGGHQTSSSCGSEPRPQEQGIPWSVVWKILHRPRTAPSSIRDARAPGHGARTEGVTSTFGNLAPTVTSAAVFVDVYLHGSVGF
jgi:hypothetical protein